MASIRTSGLFLVAPACMLPRRRSQKNSLVPKKQFFTGCLQKKPFYYGEAVLWKSFPLLEIRQSRSLNKKLDKYFNCALYMAYCKLDLLIFLSESQELHYLNVQFLALSPLLSPWTVRPLTEERSAWSLISSCLCLCLSRM